MIITKNIEPKEAVADIDKAKLLVEIKELAQYLTEEELDLAISFVLKLKTPKTKPGNG